MQISVELSTNLIYYVKKQMSLPNVKDFIEDFFHIHKILFFCGAIPVQMFQSSRVMQRNLSAFKCLS